MAHIIVVGNEKGGSGKSTTCMHVATALVRSGFRVGALDLDLRQKSFGRYIENRRAYLERAGLSLPTPDYRDLPEVDPSTLAEGENPFDARLSAAVAALEPVSDFIVIDCPGSHTRLSQVAHSLADTLITPLNDSFVDFDLIGQVDAETFKVKKLSFFAELIWEARMKRSRMTIEQQRPEMDWIVVRNRTGHVEAKNQARLHKALTEMSRRVGFRVTQGLSERVIYRELFPSGLTLLDKGHLGELGTSHLVARQELRALVKALRLPEFSREGELELV